MGSQDGRRFDEIHLRPTYHDLLDNDAGYTRGAQIQFFDLRLRHYWGDESWRMEEFRPLDIVSLSPRNDYFNPVSWKVNVGWTRKHFSSDEEPLVFRLNLGPGLAYSLSDRFDDNSAYYAFLEAALDVGKRFEKDYALGAGATIGLLTNVSDRWKINLYARSLRYGLGDDHYARALVLEQRCALTRQFALGLQLFRKQEFQNYWNGGDINFNFYF